MKDIIQDALRDESAMAALLRDIQPFVYRLAFHLTRHQQDAEDIAQEVLYKVCTRLSSFRGDSSLQTWVYSMVVNAHRDALRRKKVRAADPLPEQIPVVSFELQSDTRLLLEQLLAHLPEMDRHILILRFLNGLSVREVSEVLEMSEANVKTRVFRLRQQLKTSILSGGEPDAVL